MLVYVINRHGKPLMPCKPQKARKLLKEQKAKVVKRTPFTIQLLYGSSGYRQDVTFGVDAGSKTIGLSATTENREVFSAEVELRTDIEVELKVKRNSSFRDADFMGIMRWAFYDKLKELYSNVSLTFGYITKHARIKHNLEKSHRINARCISGNPSTKESDCWYFFKQVRKQNRRLHKTNPKKGIRRENKAPGYVHGYQLFDKVEYLSRECFVFGRRSSGYFDLRTLDGEVVSRSASVGKLKLVERASSLLCERREASFLTELKPCVS